MIFCIRAGSASIYGNSLDVATKTLAYRLCRSANHTMANHKVICTVKGMVDGPVHGMVNSMVNGMVDDVVSHLAIVLDGEDWKASLR